MSNTQTILLIILNCGTALLAAIQISKEKTTKVEDFDRGDWWIIFAFSTMFSPITNIAAIVWLFSTSCEKLCKQLVKNRELK